MDFQSGFAPAMATQGDICTNCGFRTRAIDPITGTYCTVCEVCLMETLPGSLPTWGVIPIDMTSMSSPHYGMGQQSVVGLLPSLPLLPDCVLLDVNNSSGGTINPQQLYNGPITPDADLPDFGIPTAGQDLPVGMPWLPQTPESSAQGSPLSSGFQEPVQSSPTQSTSTTGSNASKPHRQVKAYSCEACRKRKVKCMKGPEGESTCGYCWNKNLECKSTGVDRRTNKTNQRELQCMVEEYRNFGVVLLRTLRHIGGLSSRDPLEAVVFPTLVAANPTGCRLKDVRDSKGAVEEAGIELLGSLHHLCQQAHLRRLGPDEIDVHIEDAKRGTFDPKLLNLENTYAQKEGRDAKQKLLDTPDPAPATVAESLGLGTHESNESDQEQEQMIDSPVQSPGDEPDRECEEPDQQRDDLEWDAEWRRRFLKAWAEEETLNPHQ